MTANIDTILILGATSGIGEAFARYFHSKGKKVIASGRRIERLDALKSELAGLDTVQIDVEDIQTLESKLQAIIKSYPNLDSVFVMSGKMDLSFFTGPNSTTTDKIVSEVTTNLIAPLVTARTIIPHLSSLDRPATFITVSSGLAFVPLPFYPVYNATKAGIHSFTVSLRSQLGLAGTNVTLIELAPPYVDTGLDAHYRETSIALQGGKEKAHKPMPLAEYMETTTAQFEKGGEKEVGTGFSAMGIDVWRGAFGPILANMGMKG